MMLLLFGLAVVLFLLLAAGATATVSVSINGLGQLPQGQIVVADNAIVTANPASVLAAQPSTLTTRTDHADGTLTMTNSLHGIVTGQRLDLYWSGGQTFNVTAGSVSGVTVPITCNTTGLSAPATPTTGSVAGGTITGTTYYVKLTYVNAQGETTPSTEHSQAVSTDNLLTVTSPIASGVGELAATGYNVYVSTTTNTETLQNATPLPIGTGWTQPTTNITGSGATVPAANTSGANLPALNSAIAVGVPEQVVFDVTGGDCQFLAFGCQQQAAYCVFDVGTADELAVCLAQGQGNWTWINGFDGPNPLAGLTLTSVWLSHAYTGGPLANLLAVALTH